MYLNLKRTYKTIVFAQAFCFVALSLPSPSYFRKIPISNDDGNDNENVTFKINSHFFKRPRDFPTRFECQMSVKFPGVEFLETTPLFKKRKKKLSSCVYTCLS